MGNRLEKRPFMNSTAVFLVDDDAAILRVLERLLTRRGYAVRPYQSANRFLAEHDDSVPGCAVLDLVMPEMNGLAIQQELSRSGAHRSIIFLSGRGDIPSGVAAMKSGAVDFLVKPVREGPLLDAIGRAVELNECRRANAVASEERLRRLDQLSGREREVIECVGAGLANKETAARLGIVEKTVKVHRARALTKLGIRTVSDIVRFLR